MKKIIVGFTVLTILSILVLLYLFVYPSFTTHCPSNTPLELLNEMGGYTCLPCDIDFAVEAKNCTKACPNNYEKDGVCYPPCSEERPLRTKNGHCESCNDERDLPVVNCSICPNRYIADREYCVLKRCPDDKPLDDQMNGCFSCDELNIIHAKNCNKCPNRYLKSMPWDSNLFYCVLKKCPANAPLRQDDGHCYSCDEKDALSSIENCNICSNRMEKDGKCVLKECPINEPLRSNNGSCYSCDTLKGIKSDNCSVCPNRELVAGFCRLTKCPSENSARGKNGSCYSCNGEFTFPVEDSKDCDICNNRSVIKDETGLNCAFTTCPDGDFKDIYGNCQSCLRLSGGIQATGEECDRCKDNEGNPTRVMLRGWCYLISRKSDN